MNRGDSSSAPRLFRVCSASAPFGNSGQAASATRQNRVGNPLEPRSNRVASVLEQRLLRLVTEFVPRWLHVDSAYEPRRLRVRTASEPRPSCVGSVSAPRWLHMGTSVTPSRHYSSLTSHFDPTTQQGQAQALTMAPHSDQEQPRYRVRRNKLPTYKDAKKQKMLCTNYSVYLPCGALAGNWW